MHHKNKFHQLDEDIQALEKIAFERGFVGDQIASDPAPACQPPMTNALEIEKKGNFDVSSGSKRLLVIDDDAAFREMLKRLLQQCGYEVCAAADGNEGLRLQLENQFDLIISDIIMPEKDGIETIAEIRERFSDAKIIVMSGGGWYGTDIDFDMARKLGAATLDKPFAMEEITKLIQRLLE